MRIDFKNIRLAAAAGLCGCILWAQTPSATAIDVSKSAGHRATLSPERMPTAKKASKKKHPKAGKKKKGKRHAPRKPVKKAGKS